MKISVIMPVYNAENFLRRSIEALLGQNYSAEDFEIIAVDNNSTDESVRILEQYDSVRTLSESKQGSYCARNTGIAVARGAVFAFIDPDCVPEPDWLTAIKSSFETSEVEVVLGCRRPARESGLLASIADYENAKDAFVFGADSKEKYYGYTNNMAVRATTMQRFGPFVERPRGSDTIFVRTVVDETSTRSVCYQEEMVVRHLELTGTLAYCRKMFIYGRSRRLYQHLKVTQPLSRSDRILIYRTMIRKPGAPVWRVIQLLVALAMGMVAWNLGSVTGKLKNGFVKLLDERF